MKEKRKSKSTESIFTVSMMIFVIPAYVYLCSYSYEKGICSFYGIPSEFIRPDLTSNLYYSISLFFSVYLIYYLPHHLAFLSIGERLAMKPELYPFFRANLILFIACLGVVYTATYNLDWVGSLIMFLIAL
ncbi:hypothetical protein SAMN05661099_1173 [Daejeonella lutea]|uniref:Uncharacterized protein n=1 Tax=Daejeonella lutea TaxID=572036 RepID=A0A1T5B0C1_9SPHI|nr:hypothetical protein SAMN05661099_1173 [Daejeonella lutea]